MLKWLKNGFNKSSAAPEALKGTVQADALRAQGNTLLGQDNFAEAARCYEQALALNPSDAAALVNLGFAECELQRHVQARQHLAQAIALAPGNHEAHFFLGMACEQAGDPSSMASAIDAYARCTQLEPAFEPAWQNLCRVLFQAGRQDEARTALARAAALNPQAAWPHLFGGNFHSAAGQFAQATSSYREAIRRAPDDGQLHGLLAALLMQQGLLEPAIISYKEAVRFQPANAEGHSNLGNVLRLAGRLDEALASCAQAVALDPTHSGAHNNLGTVQMERGDAASALASFDRAIALDPDFFGALGNRGVALAALMRHAEAIASFDAALKIQPDSVDVLNSLGNALQFMGRPEEALAAYDAALRVNPADAPTLNHRGNVLHSLGRQAEALKSYQAALAARPNFAHAHNNLGNALNEMNRLDEAVAAYGRALQADPGYAEAMLNRGNTLRNLGRLEEALASYEQALALKPGLPYLYGNWLHARMQACDWRDLDAHFSELAARVAGGQQPQNPFTMLATNLSLEGQLQCAQTYASTRHPAQNLPAPAKPRSRHERIRIGYFSADFHEHATAWLMAELFELHDRERFELIAFSFGPDARGPMRTRLQKAFDQFHEVNGRSDREVALLAQELEVDIAVDLKGYTQNSRPGIFAFRPAPLQVSYLGYPGTMGVPWIDYIVADAVVLPARHHHGYTEKVASLPHSYQVNDSHREISPRAFTRTDAGLPPTGFVFCCFNNNYKITPELFDVWMRLLKQVEGSVLWLLEGNAVAARNLRAEAQARGIDPARLVFAGRMQLPEHLARHRLADLFLDTTWCNAHTTASDALWAGLPVLTCPQETFAGRVAASLVTAVGLPELAVASLADYEAKALALARDATALAGLKARLEHNRLTQPLFNARIFCGHLEAAYSAMWARHEAGLEPGHFSVEEQPGAVV